MRFFDLYSMDIGQVYNLSNGSIEAGLELVESYIKVTTYSKEILHYLKEHFMDIEEDGMQVIGQSKEPKIIPPPKHIAIDIIEKNNLNIEAGSYKYYTLLGEILLGLYIHERRADNIVSVLTAIQSFCGTLESPF